MVKSPAYRFDIEIEEDLVEEVARLYGYEKLPDLPPLARCAMRCPAEGTRSNHALRVSLAGLGYQELVNFSFVQEQWEKDFAGNEQPIRLLNPIASQLSVMRTQLLGGLVDVLRFNLNRKAENVRVFELGRVFFPDESIGDSETSVKGVRQPMHVAGLVYGDAHEDCWAEAKRSVDFFDVKGDVENLIAPLKATFEAATHPAMHPGRCARVIVNGKAVGFVGELHPKVCRTYELSKPPVVFELEVAPLCELDVPSARAVSKFQPVHRDISVTVPNDVTCAQLQDAVSRIRRTKPEAMIIESLDLFDVYRPEASAEKSMAFRLTLSTQGAEAIGEKEAEAAFEAVERAFAELGATLRK